MKIIFKSLFFLVISLCVFVLQIKAVCSDTSEPLGKLLSVSEDSNDRIPLILIHGIHGTEKEETVIARNKYWDVFIDDYWHKDTQLQSKYSLYVFQYCSNKNIVQDIAEVLGKEIELRIPNREHLILAHSMGGLVAKAYMVYYTFKSGKLKGKKGGDGVLNIITLATPHHGTPGANDLDALEPYMKLGWKTVLGSVNLLYWRGATGEFLSPQLLNSGNPNRSDLRWDNYDKAISTNNLAYSDINIWLPHANSKFAQYSNKIILYAGFRRFSNISRNPATALLELPINKFYNPHLKLNYANDLLINGFSNRFGNTDGLVPIISAMLCSPPPYITSSNNTNFLCISNYKVRRFEAGNKSALPNELPDKYTLSITRRTNGYDHKDMYEHPDVLRLVLSDLRKVVNPNGNTETRQTSVIPEIPTLFLMDISDSMNENNKFSQAKSAGLGAIGEMKINRQRGQDNSSVSVSTFGGDCNPNNVKNLMPFTTNLNQAETVFRQGIPRPNGSTPLYTAINLSVEQMFRYLNSRSNLKEARIIVLTDGLNTCSEQIRPRGVYSQNQSRNSIYKNVRFYCIGFDIAPGSKEERDLQYLASASGGKYFPARDSFQLKRVLQKSIKIYFPKVPVDTGSDLYQGTQSIVNQDFENALKILQIYIQKNPNDAIGYYNLAVVCEATDRYKCAVGNYQKYLQLSGNADDLKEIEIRIEQLEEDYRIEIIYYTDVLRSDLDYLKSYYKRLFEAKNDELAAEFKGFVSEKRNFYRNIQDILEIRTARIKRSSTELADSLDYLDRRVGLASFDRDAVSLLTLPISHLEDLIKHIETAQNQ